MDGRSLEETPWLYPKAPLRFFVPDPYLCGENWSQLDALPRYLGPITVEMEQQRVQCWDPSLEPEPRISQPYKGPSPPKPGDRKRPAQGPHWGHVAVQQELQQPVQQSPSRYHSPSKQHKALVSRGRSVSQPAYDARLSWKQVTDSKLAEALMHRNLPLGGSREQIIDRIIAFHIGESLARQEHKFNSPRR